MKKKTILSSLLTIILCLSLIAGSTYALFTSKDQVNIAVTSGKVNVVATILDTAMKTFSLGTEQAAGKFANGGTAVFATNEEGEKVLTLDKMTPGDKVTFSIQITNNSNVAMKYRVVWAVEGVLSEVLTATAGGDKIENGKSAWASWPVPAAEDGSDKVKTIDVVIELPADTNNDYQEKTATIVFTVEATQGNAPEVDEWDGTADTSWYDSENPQTEYTLSTAEQFLGLSELVSGDRTFKDVTFTLANDLDLYCEDTTEFADGDPLTFRPIGDHSKNGTFEGVFDGNGHTISNLYQNGWDLGYEWGVYGSYGLFGNLNNATIKNLTIVGTESYIEGGDVSFVAGSATGNCVFENITIEDGTIATYNNGCGGIIGWSGAGTYTFKNITIGEDVVLGGLWGSFDSSIGGIVGQAEPGATYIFENVEVNCRLDAYNDVTASYDYYNYRMCGMLIGRLEETTSIDGSNYPDTSKYDIQCTNVVVNYGDWMNYHYCRPQGGRGIRVEAGYQYGGIAADYDHDTCTVHHMECIPFDQIFGGDQFGVKGLKTYEGVTVNYPSNN